MIQREEPKFKIGDTVKIVKMLKKGRDLGTLKLGDIFVVDRIYTDGFCDFIFTKDVPSFFIDTELEIVIIPKKRKQERVQDRKYGKSYVNKSAKGS
jgi:hypothetical protein